MHMFYRSLLVFLCFFFWPLYRLVLFDIWILITLWYLWNVLSSIFYFCKGCLSLECFDIISMGLRLELLYFISISTICQLYRDGQVLCGRNRNTRRKRPTCHKSLKNFSTYFSMEWENICAKEDNVV